MFDLGVADIEGTRQGPTLLVTAGLDGDEYAGIAAAFRAAELYKDATFAGRLTILPIVNVAGFDARISINPVDNKFPKYCIPGRLFGTESERRMRHITKTYAARAALWLDLHSGARDEIAIPCVWNDITGVERVDTRGEAFIHAAGVEAAVREPAGRAADALSRYGCTYVLAESEDEEQHLVYIERAMQVLGLVPGTPFPKPPRIFQKTRDMYAPDEHVGDNELVLWHKTTAPLEAGGRVGEIAYDELKR